MLALLGTASAQAPDREGLAKLNQVLAGEDASSLSLSWTQGSPGSPTRRLVIASNQVKAETCEPACAPLGTPFTLTGGEQSQLLSRLRASNLGGLRSAPPEAADSVDRSLSGLRVGGARVGSWSLSRADWPTGPDGTGLADFLDELTRRLERSAAVRPLVAVPKTVADLQGVRLKLKVTARRKPGGVLTVEGGKLRLEPEEGSVPRVPRPGISERALTAAEQDRLAQLLTSSRFEELDTLVPKRGQPAIGDDDGRLATLHLLPTAETISKSAAPPQARGVERYVADLSRSPAEPLLAQLLGWLSTPATATAAPTAKGKEK